MEKSEKRKVLVTAHRHDETEIFEKINQRFGFLLTYMPEQLTLENTERLKGYDAVAINAGCKVDQDMARAMQAAGIRFIATRTAGKDHIDKDEIKKCGIKAANVPGYSPNAISEHTVLLILSLLRKMKTQLKRIEEQYFFLNGLRGRELKSMTVGVIGTGKIGTATIQDLSGFGCRILANGHHPNPEVQRLAEQVDLETLQYDLLYGDRYSYKENGETFERTKMHMGLYDVSLESMELVSDTDFTYRLKGTNFTPSSQVKLNGEWVDTVYINPTTLMISGTELNDFDRVSVSQRSNSSTRKALSKSYDRSAYMLYSENKWKLPTEENES